jgi:hypothetical protein
MVHATHLHQVREYGSAGSSLPIAGGGWKADGPVVTISGADAAKSLAALFATVVLSACYGSPKLLLDPDEAAHPIADGVYQRQGEAERYQVSVGSDGWYQVEEIEAGGLIGQSHRVLLNEVTLDGGREAFAVAEQADEGYEYAVALVDHGRVFLATPDCADPLDRNDAVDHDGQPEDDNPMTRICSFKTRGALVAALAAFAGHANLGVPYFRQ